MTIYHQFKDNDVEYFIIDKFTKTDPYFLGNVYVTLEDTEYDSTLAHHLCTFMECADCELDDVCSSSDSDRLQEAIKLCPSILTNFPELGV